jgi:hypothetical protein
LSVPAHAAGSTPATRHLSEGVTHPPTLPDTDLLIASAAANPAVSDRQLRVYVLIATVFDRGVDADTIAANLPSLNTRQAARLLGELVSAGLLAKRLRTVGYKPGGDRIRRGFYTLVGGEHA